MKAPKFSYVRAESVEQALALLDEHGEEARILAGGQSLMPTLNMRLSQPRLLIDINRLDALRGISLEGDRVRIGALARHVEVANSPIVAEHLPLIAEAMPHVAHVAVRNRGTFGGSIALADPAAEMPACALALGATFVVCRARRGGARSRRRTTSRASTRPRAGRRAAGRGADPREAAGPRVGVHGAGAPARRFRHRRRGLRSGDRARRGGGWAARLFRQRGQADAGAQGARGILGKRLDGESGEAAAAALAEDLKPMSSPQGSAKMRLHLQRVLTRRALDVAAQRAGRRHERRGDHADIAHRQRRALRRAPCRCASTWSISCASSSGLTGAHLGCEHGVCGACSVRVDGAVVRGCLMLAVQADGAEVVTIEGLADTGEIADLQAAFVERNALQCGFCTPGMLMTSAELLAQAAPKSREEIREFLSGNYCRCTGYHAIVDAVETTLNKRLQS